MYKHIYGIHMLRLDLKHVCIHQSLGTLVTWETNE